MTARSVEGVFSVPPDNPPDPELVRRIKNAYHLSIGTLPSDGGQWTLINSWKAQADDILRNGTEEEIEALLSHPGGSNILYGFDSLYEEQLAQLHRDAQARRFHADNIVTAIRRLATAVGVLRAENSEAPEVRPPNPQLGVVDLLDLIGQKFRIKFDFPNPFPEEYGIASPNGVISVRAIYSIYQFIRIAFLLKLIRTPSVIEVGASLCRTAYYAFTNGIQDYTLVGLPLSNAIQAYYLAKTIGPDKVSLFGEDHRKGRVNILPPDLGKATPIFGLLLNADSLTEMGRGTAEGYVTLAKRRAQMIYSINHEVNAFTVQEVVSSMLPNKPILRSPHPLRIGYVEEIVFIAP